ncbi:hypothetical protein AMECASPLE_030739, partial [Ameca splendens]
LRTTNLNHSTKALFACLWLLFSWKVNLLLLVKGSAAITRFFSRISPPLAPSFFLSTYLPCPCKEKTSSQHDSATTMFRNRDALFKVMCGVSSPFFVSYIVRGKW